MMNKGIQSLLYGICAMRFSIVIFGFCSVVKSFCYKIMKRGEAHDDQ